MTPDQHEEPLTCMRKVLLAGYPSELYNDVLHDWLRAERNHMQPTANAPHRGTMDITKRTKDDNIKNKQLNLRV